MASLALGNVTDVPKVLELAAGTFKTAEEGIADSAVSEGQLALKQA